MKKTKSSQQIIILLEIILWILFVLIGYYYYHKPITVEKISMPLSSLLELTVAVAIVGLCAGIGRRILRADILSGPERTAVQFGLGVGIISFVWLGLGYLGLYNRIVGIMLLVIGLFLLRKETVAWFQEFSCLLISWKESKPLEKVFAGAAVLLIAYQLFIALAPPNAWDSLAYHLQLPRQFIEAGRMVFRSENPYWGHPEIGEMLFTFAIATYHAETAALVGWLAGVVTLFGVFGMANTQSCRLFGNTPQNTGHQLTKAGWAAVIALVVGSTYRWLMSSAYTDILATLFGMAVFITFFEWINSRQRTWFFLSILFSGFAMGVKWTAGVLFISLLITTYFIARQNGEGPRKIFLHLWLPAVLIAFGSVLPWLIKNWLGTGNPIYPYIFATPWLNAERIASANEVLTNIDWWQHILLPFSTTWAGIAGAPGFSADIGPILLLLAGPFFVRYRHYKPVKTVGIALLTTALAIGIASLRFGHLLQTRLYYAIIPGVAMVAGLGWVWMEAKVLEGVRLRRVLGAILLLIVFLSVSQESLRPGNLYAFEYSLGIRSRQSYLENTLGYYILAMQRLDQLPQDSKILLLWEPRGLYAPPNAEADLWIDRWRTDVRELKSAQAIKEHWKAKGFTYLMVYQLGEDLIAEQDEKNYAAYQEMLKLLPSWESIGDVYWLYKIQ